MNEDLRLRQVESGPWLEQVRVLFLEYAHALDFNLCFQDFDRELEQLPGPYRLPRGRLILCEIEGKPAGCIALKPLEPGVCEMKRLFVRPEYRSRGVGQRLVRHIIEEARAIGYSAMRLDTIRGAMDNAIRLYRSFGFKEIPPYYNNPIPNAYYMEVKL